MSTRTHGGVALFLLGSLVCLSLPPPAHAQFNCGSLVQEPSYVSRSDINQLGLTITIRNQFGVPQPGCPLQLTLLSVVNSYGHQHSGGRPVGSLTPSTCNTGANGLGCNTIWGSPEVSGQIVLRLSANPPGATCSNGFPINTTDFAMCVQIDGLVDLGTGTGYSLTGQTATHPVNHYATPEMKSALQALAMKFSAETGLTLGINDISLIKGGIFDYKPSTNPWMPPHASHRLGVDADIDLMPPAQRRRFLNMLAEVNPNLVRIREPGTFTHFNDVTSPRGIWSFTLRPVPSVFNVTSPQGWEAQVGFQEPDQLNWFCMDPGPNPPDNDGNVAPSPYDIAPGQTGMFSFKTPVAPALGGMTFFLQGFSEIPIAQSDESDVDALLDSQPLFLDDSLMGQTDGPMSFVGIAPVEAPPGNYIVGVAPNPSISAQANMTFRLDHQAQVKVDLFDVAGRKVRGLFDGQLPQGDHMVIWRGEADDGRPISAGLYYYRLIVDGVPIDSKAVVLVP